MLETTRLSSPVKNIVYRCNRCGVESTEATCFVGAPNKASPLVRTCITCGRPPQTSSQLRNVFALCWLLLLPLFFLIGFKEKSSAIFPELLLAACLIEPLALILHEMGHFLTARLLGLEVSLITLGVGPNIWTGNVLGTRVQIQAWPLAGLTYLGSRSLRFLRLRVWLTALMGPGTNFLLVVAAVTFWDPLTHKFGANIVILWMIFNGLYAVVNLFPARSRRAGVMQRTDGFHLLQIPFGKSTDLAVYLSATALVGAMQLFQDQDYAGARRACLQGLERLPSDPTLNVILSACHVNLGDYEPARAALEPLINSAETLTPDLRAAVENNLALSLWLRDFDTAQRDETLPRADALLDRAYRTFPCELAIRTSRALLLTATSRPQDALALLEYVNYERGSQDNRANRHIARAFALRQLSRNDEAEAALEAGLSLTKKPLPWLTTIGLIP
jgi:tetratricopeptide (TPR) repeat protein